MEDSQAGLYNVYSPPKAGVQEAPTKSTASALPVRLDEVDFLRYQLLREKFSKAQLLGEMYHRELQRAQIELAELGPQVAANLRGIEEKYQVDMHLVSVTADGFLVVQVPAGEDVLRGRSG